MRLLQEYQGELQAELDQLLNWWMRHCPDPVYGGFYGRIDNANQVYPQAERGLVLCSRLLWAFAAAYRQHRDPRHLDMSLRAFHCIRDHFEDPEFGGLYWSIDFSGKPLDNRKQTYGQAFAIYGLSELYGVHPDHAILDLAINLQKSLQEHAFDRQKKGYFEAFGHNWQSIPDLPLRAGEPSERKSMRTQLHVLEAYTNLYGVWRNAGLKSHIENLLEVFVHHIIDDRTNHLHLFFDDQWKVKSDRISYGHEIEAGWLLLRAAETIRHPGWMMTMRAQAVKLANAALEGVDPADGGLCYESVHGEPVTDKHWWVQAEAMVGFYNAYELTGDHEYLERSLDVWNFVKQHVKDPKYGEWFWVVKEGQAMIEKYDKAGFWKCPYHNTRACLELIRRIAPELKGVKREA